MVHVSTEWGGRGTMAQVQLNHAWIGDSSAGLGVIIMKDGRWLWEAFIPGGIIASCCKLMMMSLNKCHNLL